LTVKDSEHRDGDPGVRRLGVPRVIPEAGTGFSDKDRAQRKKEDG
jgi:hypothetical protein